MNLPNIRRALTDYHGPPLTFMEICGTHTAAISKNGIPHFVAPYSPDQRSGLPGVRQRISLY